MPGITINGIYLPKTIDNSTNKKNTDIIDLQLNVKISELSREIDSNIIAQLVFVIEVFIQEINNILLAVYYTEAAKSATKVVSQEAHSQRLNGPKSESTRLFYNINIEAGKISLTAVTPTYTALSVYSSENNFVFLTNNLTTTPNVKQQQPNTYLINDYTLKPFIDAKFNVNLDLKTCFTKQPNDELIRNLNKITANNDWYQLASFNTKIHLKNSIYVSNIKEYERESIIITVEKPRFFLQPGAVDNAILFWLNYKSTYGYWVDKREAYSLKNPTANHRASIVTAPSMPPANADDSKNLNFLTLKLRVSDFGLALPLSNKINKDFKTNTDCLVITLNETTVNACSSGCIVSEGKFNHFCLRFLENFKLDSSNWLPKKQHANEQFSNQDTNKTLMNSWLVPSGSYVICSSTVQNEFNQNYRKEKINRPLWILSVQWKMEGIDVNLDTSVGKWFSKLGATVTRLAETQYMNEDSTNDQMKIYRDTEIRKLKNELQYFKYKFEI